MLLITVLEIFEWHHYDRKASPSSHALL